MEQGMEKAGNFLPRVDDAALKPNQVDRRVVTLTAPSSSAAEQYRTLYYRIERMRALRPMKVMAVTSAMPGEGKTVTAVNLALTAARANVDRHVLLIDADMRRSQVGGLLGIKSKPGLSELLHGDCEMKECVRRFTGNRLAVIPAGSMPEDSTSLLAGARMKTLIAKCREVFDEVYIDLPPTLPFVDAQILGAQSDGVLMVIRANVTPFKQIQNAIDHLAGAPLVGCVLNGAEASLTPYLKAYK